MRKVVFAVLMLITSSCSTMLPAHKLEPGEVVVTGMASTTSMLGGRATLGAGPGDVSLHGGWPVASVSVSTGAAARLYMLDMLDASVMGNVLWALDGTARRPMYEVLTRIGRLLVAPDDRFYGGFSARYHDLEPRSHFWLLGGYVGVEALFSRALGFQAELGVEPIVSGEQPSFGIGFGGAHGGNEFFPAPIVHITLGVQWHSRDHD